MEVEFILITHLVFLLTLVLHGTLAVFFILLVYMQILFNCVNEFYLTKYFQKYKSFRLHGVSKENPLAPVISRLGLPLYRTSGDNSVLYDHDLER